MSHHINKLQLTLAIIKPDAIANPLVEKNILQTIKNHKFVVVQSTKLHLSRSEAERFYAEHKGRFFYNRLVSYISSGPLLAHILARSDAIAQWRSVMGPTKVFKTIYEQPCTIRGRFGLTDTRNCTHGSDSEDSARKEIVFFFPEFDIDKWLNQQRNITES